MVLGIDAMDYGIARDMMTRGRMPNCASLSERGTFMPLGTSMPPLSPVAWTNFTTGMDSGGHGVFDFFRREPAQVKDGFLPQDGVSRTLTGGDPKSIPFTPWVWPAPQKQELVRSGPPLWDLLEARGVRAVVWKMPACFPIPHSKARVLTGMGTPDVEGTYGTFTYLTDDPRDWGRDVTGGRILKVVVDNGVVRLAEEMAETDRPYVQGPVNPFLSHEIGADQRRVKVAFEVYVDRKEQTAVVVLQGADVVLKQGEWSRWLDVRFPLRPHAKSVHGFARVYLQEAAPRFRLFVSPINLAPGTTGLGTQGLDRELLKRMGPYYTKGMAEQTKALTQGIWTPREYIAQSDMVLAERLQALDLLVQDFTEGFLFVYISTLDLDSHVMWKYRDSLHPAHPSPCDPLAAERIADLYIRMDEVVGRVHRQLDPEDVLYVISDHGFVSFRREFNLVRWLHKEGYLVYPSSIRARLSKSYAGVDWSRTRAYGVGFNSLYLNLQGREASGAVRVEERDELVREIRGKLLALRDADETPVFRNVYRPEDIYSGSRMVDGPDLVLGYNAGYGPSDASVLGTWTEEVLADHLDGFSGHHAVDHEIVPGVLFSTRRLTAKKARLEDVTATILKDYDIPRPATMTGAPLY
jgi:predicted AlkP superfamily phosphohydrolase/phosphomutase